MIRIIAQLYLVVDIVQFTGDICTLVLKERWPRYYHYSNEMGVGVNEVVVSCYNYSILSAIGAAGV